MQNHIVKFIQTKDFKLIDVNLGQGGTEKTALPEEQIINGRFEFKKLLAKPMTLLYCEA